PMIATAGRCVPMPCVLSPSGTATTESTTDTINERTRMRRRTGVHDLVCILFWLRATCDFRRHQQRRSDRVPPAAQAVAHHGLRSARHNRANLRSGALLSADREVAPNAKEGPRRPALWGCRPAGEDFGSCRLRQGLVG